MKGRLSEMLARSVLCYLVLQGHGFSPKTCRYGSKSRASSATCLNLIPLTEFRKEVSFLAKPQSYRCCIDSDGTFQSDRGAIYELGLAEEEDLPDLSRFIIQSFGADAIRLSTDLNAFERAIMQPAAELVNGYSAVVAFAEVLAGLRSRLEKRVSGSRKKYLAKPKLGKLERAEKLATAAKSSVVLIVGKRQSGSDWRMDIIASVELHLQPCDAKIPFTLPWLDRIERRLGALVGIGKNGANDLQPYLSNLCVDSAFRGRQLGRALVRCVEDIASEYWGYQRLYLHVDKDNSPAWNLYLSEGYRDVGIRWKPFWAGKSADIGYYVKNIGLSVAKVDGKEQKVKSKKL